MTGTVIEAGLAAKTVVATLGMMALQGTVVAVLALVLVHAGRPRPAWQAAVWLVVLAKFALPWGPAMPWSLSDLFAGFAGGGGHGAIVLAPAQPAVTQAPSMLPAFGWFALCAIWFVGTAIVLGRGIVRHRLALAEARAASGAPAPARALLGELAARMRVRTPRLVVGDSAIGPYVVGVLRPIIAVPPVLLADHVLLRAALLHELAHVRRRDALGRVIQLAAVALFWWLPVVRFASRKLELARERACDAWALESGDISRPAYARLLLEMARLRVAAAPLAAPHALDARITTVLGQGGTIRPGLAIAHKLGLLVWAVIVLGGARSAAAHGKREVCIYTPQFAEALRQAYPAADADGDGVLSRTEACEYQAELRRNPPKATAPVSDAASSHLLAEPLCCNCGESEGLSTPLATSTEVSCTAERP